MKKLFLSVIIFTCFFINLAYSTNEIRVSLPYFKPTTIPLKTGATFLDIKEKLSENFKIPIDRITIINGIKKPLNNQVVNLLHDNPAVVFKPIQDLQLEDIVKKSFQDLNDEFKNALTTSSNKNVEHAKNKWEGSNFDERVESLYGFDFDKLPSLTSNFANTIYSLKVNNDQWYKASSKERENILKNLFSTLPLKEIIKQPFDELPKEFRIALINSYKINVENIKNKWDDSNFHERVKLLLLYKLEFNTFPSLLSDDANRFYCLMVTQEQWNNASEGQRKNILEILFLSHSLEKIIYRPFEGLPYEFREAFRQHIADQDYKTAENAWNIFDIKNRIQLLYRLKFPSYPLLLSDDANRFYNLMVNQEQWKNASEEERKNILKNLFSPPLKNTEISLKTILDQPFNKLPDEFSYALKNKDFYRGNIQAVSQGWNMSDNYSKVLLLFGLTFKDKPSLTSKEANEFYSLKVNKERWNNASEAERKNILKELFPTLPLKDTEIHLETILNGPFLKLPTEFKTALINSPFYEGDATSAKQAWIDFDVNNRVQLLYRLNFDTLPALTSQEANKTYSLKVDEVRWNTASVAERKNILKELFPNR